MNSSINFLNKKFANPLVLPSGIVQEIKQSHQGIKAGAGSVVLKSITKEARTGNPLPRVIQYDCGTLNSVGLRNPGIIESKKQVKAFLEAVDIPVFVSVFAVKIEEFKELALGVEEVGAELIELNLSCPNTVDELGESLGMGVESTEKAVAAVRAVIKSKTKLIAKLSPNVPNIDEVAKAAESAGADAISAINTVGPGMVIDIKKKQPLLGNKEGGVSGPGIKPIAIRCVYDIYKSVQIPIIGMGGLDSWEDVVEMMLAGATLVGVGSAVYTHGFKIFEEIKQGLVKYMKINKIKTLTEFVGGAH